MKQRFGFWLLLILCAAIFITPVWVFDLLPFVDYPQHLGIAHIVHNYHAGADLYGADFQLVFFPKGHVLHTLFLHLASYCVPLEIAGKLLVSFYILLLPLSLLFYIRSLGGDRWVVFLVFIFVYNFCLMWGFIGFCLGCVIFLIIMGVLVRYNRLSGEVPLAYTGAISLLLLLAFLAHAMIFFLSLIAFLVTLLVTHRRRIAGYRHILAVVPAALFFVLSIRGAWQEEGGVWALAPFPAWMFQHPEEILRRIAEFPDNMSVRLPVHTLALLFFGVAALFIILRGREEKALVLDGENLIACAMIIVVASGYLFLPHGHRMTGFIGQRLAVVIPLLAIGPLSRVKVKGRGVVVCTGALLSLLLVTRLWPVCARFNEDASPVRPLLSRASKGKTIVGLYYRDSFRRVPEFDSFLHFACYYQIWRDGLAGFIFPDINRWHVVERKKGSTRKTLNEWRASKSLFPEGWERYDYYLVCGFPPAKEEIHFSTMRLIGREGIWALYERGAREVQ
jgi:hypothetical protein